jgi:hypothetical protein
MAPLPLKWSFADKVYPEARDVRKQRHTIFEGRRKCDPLVAGADGNRPSEAAGE